MYFDHAAATPVRQEVLDTMLPFFSEKFANPSAIHDAGREVKEAIDAACASVSRMLGCDTVIFTSSGTESINLALRSVLNEGDHVITTKIEHKAILETCRSLDGVRVTYVDVDSEGLVDLNAIENAITEKTKLISIHYVNNEIGTIQDIVEIGRIAKEKGVLFHVDACQAGFLELDMKKLGVDLMTVNGSKIYGPKGVGALAVRGDVSLKPLLYGGGQEDGLRAGTENVPGIIGFAKALALAQQEKDTYNAHVKKLRDLFVDLVLENVKDVVVNGSIEKRVVNNANLQFVGVEGETLLLYLNQHAIYASSGSACTANEIGVSHVLLRIGLTEEEARSSLRFTLGRGNTEKDVHEVVRVLGEVVASLRSVV